MEIMNTHYCNNCGNYGHLYRQCKLPVLSYGILVFNVNSGANKLLMIQRKDSISYIEFIRGKYELTNPEYIIQLFTNCSVKEKEFLKNHTFNEIWDNLWIKVTNQSERIKNEYNGTNLSLTIKFLLYLFCRKNSNDPPPKNGDSIVS